MAESKGFASPSLPKVKTKDELLLMLNKIKIEGGNKSEDVKLEDWH